MRHHPWTMGLLLMGASCSKPTETGSAPVDVVEPYVPDYDDANCRGDFIWTSWEERSDNGAVDFTLELPEGRSFQMTVEARQDDIVTMASQVTHPSGAVAYTWNDWNNTSQNYTYAAYPETAVSTLNYPVRASDEPYEAGTWLIEFFTLDRTGDYIDGVPVSIWLYVAQDDSLETGCVYVDVSYADGVSGNEAITAAVEQAFARWNQIWLDYGLKVIPLNIRSAAIDADAPSPQAGDEVYDELSRSDEPILQLVIAETISGEAALGEAGSIPGSLASTPHAAVTLSWLQHAGKDGTLDDQDVQTMGETMAHEAGHFLGLFHPVEFSDGQASSYDALSDTPACTSRSDCDDSLESNLMYPYATGAVQDVLSAEQVGVLQRWTGVQ